MPDGAPLVIHLLGNKSTRMIQTQFDFSGRENRDNGMQKAIESTEAKHPDWSERAFQLFNHYLSMLPKKQTFLMEDFREYAEGRLPAPRSNRVFGPIAMKAARLGIIERVGYTQVKNPNANMANASVWRKR
jgi:hypothetical protein